MREPGMKKFFENFSHIGCLLPFILGGLLPIAGILIVAWKLCNGNIWRFIINILAIPFIFIGAINIFRGFFAILDKDAQNFEFKKYWHFAIYFIITIAGYVAIFLAIAKFIIK
jgi:hypothetical protein